MSRDGIRRSKPMARSTVPLRRVAMKSSRRVRGAGLGQVVARELGTTKKTQRKPPIRMRSVQHRMNVAALPCVVTGQVGGTQCAHANFDKGGALKACDSMSFSMSVSAHQAHDHGGMDRDERRRRELAYVRRTRQQLLRLEQWTEAAEGFYQRWIVALERVAVEEVISHA